jgi:hypothetical protein
LVLSFPKLAILVGKKMEKIVQIKEKCKQQQKNSKKKRLFLMSKNLKIILIIPTLNI